MKRNRRANAVRPTVALLWLAGLAMGCSFDPQFEEGTIVCTGSRTNECPPGFSCSAGVCRTRPLTGDASPADTPITSVDSMPVDRSSSSEAVTRLDGAMRADAVDGRPPIVDAEPDGKDAAADAADAPTDRRDAPPDVPTTALDGASGVDVNPPKDIAAGIDGGTDAPPCSVCTDGEQRCVSGGVQTCTVVAGCAIWGSAVPCDGRKLCKPTGANAVCACPAAPVGCEGGSGTVCSGNVLRTCKVGSIDGCIFEDSTQQCTVGRPCQGAFPAAACTCPVPPAECNGTQGTLCSSGTTVATCGFNLEGCLAITQQTTCPAGKPCTGAFPSANCSCPPGPPECGGSPGKVCAAQYTIETCGVDSLGCLAATSVTACPAGTSCQGVAPNAACLCPPVPSECSQGVGDSCDASGQLVTCARDANNCLLVTQRTTCPGITSCQGTSPSASCRCPAPPSYCSAPGTVCVDNATVGTCTSDPQGCLIGTTASCTPNGQICQTNGSGAACVCPAPPTECPSGAGNYCAADSTLYVCRINTSGCLISSKTTCPKGEYCSGPAPQCVCAEPVPVPESRAKDFGYDWKVPADTLAGQAITLTSTYIFRGFGVISRVAAKARFALYSSDRGGAPYRLVADTGLTEVAAGVNELARAGSIGILTLDPGTYWMMGLYPESTAVGGDRAMSADWALVPLPFGKDLPDPIVEPSSAIGANVNYYLVLTPR